MAAVTFSGFNNIDFNQVVSAIMAQERQPLTRLESQQSTLEAQKTAFGSLATKLTAIQSALDAVTSNSGISALTATSTDAAVTATATGGSIEGAYDIIVSSIARRQVTASVTTYASTDAVVATGGSVTLTAVDGSTTTIAVDALMTVKELVDAINAANEAPVTASLVQSTPGNYQIVLTGRHTGTDNAFTVSTALSGGAGLAFTNTNGGAAGDSPEDNVQNATNAAFSVNGLAVISTSNTVNDVVPGVTLTLNKEDAAKTVAVTVTRDATSATEKVKTLVTAYNDLVGFINEQRTAAIGGKASIARDPVVQQLKNSLRSALLGSHANSGDHQRLAEVGLGFDLTGKMVLDLDTFERAIGEDPTSVQSLFAGDDGESGAMGSVRDLIDQYTRSGGLVADVRQRLSTQVQSLSNRIDALEEQLERRRLTLQQEFAAADEAMSQLNSQVASLSSLGGQYRLF